MCNVGEIDQIPANHFIVKRSCLDAQVIFLP